MNMPTLIKPALIAAALFASAAVLTPANGGMPAGEGAAKFESRALRAPQSRMEADAAIDASVAGALVGAIVTSFDEREVQVQLGDVQLHALDLEQSEASGQGRLLLGKEGEGEWIPFTFTALYDAQRSTASMPRLQIGRAHALEEGTPLDGDSDIAQQLHRNLASRLEIEFPDQRPGLILGDLRMHRASAGHASVQAVGTVDFGDDGWTMATVDALYDTRSQRLVRVDYSL